MLAQRTVDQNAKAGAKWCRDIFIWLCAMAQMAVCEWKTCVGRLGQRHVVEHLRSPRMKMDLLQVESSQYLIIPWPCCVVKTYCRHSENVLILSLWCLTMKQCRMQNCFLPKCFATGAANRAMGMYQPHEGRHERCVQCQCHPLKCW